MQKVLKKCEVFLQYFLNSWQCFSNHVDSKKEIQLCNLKNNIRKALSMQNKILLHILKVVKKCSEKKNRHLPGIEPGPAKWQADMLPQSYGSHFMKKS